MPPLVTDFPVKKCPIDLPKHIEFRVGDVGKDKIWVLWDTKNERHADFKPKGYGYKRRVTSLRLMLRSLQGLELLNS